ncbi:hemerythrin domain-containing protein [Pelagibius sp. 7325]|uniref:hemerythrin domain-containing protein n=1 Tax=Pelagibius sp. 7325 TaxID=3131994 RepID=UPI0030EDE5E4
MAHIIARLKEDRAAVEEVFGRLRAVNGSAEDRDALYSVLGRFFAALTKFEESVFYSAVRESAAATSQGVDLVIGQAVSEHREILKLLRTITDLEPSDPECARARNTLEQAVRSHFEREAAEIFPLAARVISDDVAEEMTLRHDAMARDAMVRERV